MVDVATLNKELEDITAKRAELRNQYAGETMPEGERDKDIAYMDRAEKLVILIEKGKQAERDAQFAKTQEYMNNPQMKIPHAVNADDAGRKVLANAGWETKNGMMTRMTSIGKEVAFCPVEVMFGPMPDNAEQADYFRKTRAIAQPEYRAAYAKYIQNCGRYGDPSVAMQRLTGPEQNALSEGSDTAGGYLVPPDIQTEILARLAQQSVFRQLARIVPTTRDRVSFPTLKANASSGSIYSSAFVGDWAGETPVFADTDPSFQNFEVGVKKVRVATKLSNDFISDAGGGVLAMLTEDGSQNMALVEENGFLTGLGTGLQPLGLLNVSGITTVDVEGSTSNTISNTTSAAGSSPKLQDLIYALPSQYAGNAAMLMCRAIEGKTRKLVDGMGRPIWLSYQESGLGVTPRNIDGIPVYNSEFMPTDGTDANKVYAYGDFRNYIIVERAQISTRVLNERFADSDQTGIIISERVGGGAWNTDAFRFGIV